MFNFRMYKKTSFLKPSKNLEVICLQNNNTLYGHFKSHRSFTRNMNQSKFNMYQHRTCVL